MPSAALPATIYTFVPVHLCSAHRGGGGLRWWRFQAWRCRRVPVVPEDKNRNFAHVPIPLFQLQCSKQIIA